MSFFCILGKKVKICDIIIMRRLLMMIKVVACLIEKDNKVLIAKRSTGDPNVLGK